jgi:hypothetical protein
MMADEFDFTEPWDIFADENQPWKDLDRLLELDEKMETQNEVADALGCSPSTISYWLQKARDSREAGLDQDNPCFYNEVCGNEAPGPNNGACDDCLYLARLNEHLNEKYKTKGLDPESSESMTEHIAALHEEYQDKL